jgi:hypothetical protein
MIVQQRSSRSSSDLQAVQLTAGQIQAAAAAAAAAAGSGKLRHCSSQQQQQQRTAFQASIG